MTTADIKCIKRALVRCPAECCPVGRPGHMHINCVCGERIALGWGNRTGDDSSFFPCRICGTQYTANGWIIDKQTNTQQDSLKGR